MYKVHSFWYLNDTQTVFECGGQIYQYEDEAAAIEQLKKAANAMYKKCKNKAPFDITCKYQIRKHPASNKIAWYYCNTISSEGPGTNYEDKGSFLFEEVIS